MANSKKGAARRRRLSEQERLRRAAIRAELKAQGIIPADKKRLDRKRLSAEALEILKDRELYKFGIYLLWALMEMIDHTDREGRRDKEAVGAAKAVLLAARRQDYEREQSAQGRHEFTLGEIYEAVKDIYNA